MKRHLPLLPIGICAVLLLFSGGRQAAAQQRMSPADHEKKLAESIENEVIRLQNLLKLEDWQVFYADSILNHNFRGADEELKQMNDAKVSNYDLYMEVNDRWAERTYEALRRILTETQWAKYNKSGAAAEQKSRMKRRERRSKS